MFEDIELPIGKVAPGETKTFTAKLKLPQGRARSRRSARPRGPRGAQRDRRRSTPAELHDRSRAAPGVRVRVAAVDDGNGDGLVQRGEKYHLAGPGQEHRRRPDAGGDRAAAQRDRRRRRCSTSRASSSRTRSRPARSSELEFPLATDATLKGDELVVELMAYDSALDVQAEREAALQAVAGGRRARPRTATSPSKAATTIHAGASDDTERRRHARQGRELPGDRHVRPVDEGQARRGRHQGRLHRRPRRCRSGGAGSGPFTPTWNSTPPLIALTTEEPRDPRRHLQAAGHRHRRAARRGRLRLRVEPEREDREPQGVLPLEPRRQGRQARSTSRPTCRCGRARTW